MFALFKIPEFTFGIISLKVKYYSISKICCALEDVHRSVLSTVGCGQLVVK